MKNILHKKRIPFLAIILSVLLIVGCKNEKKEVVTLYIYASKDTLLVEENVYKQVPYVISTLQVNKNKTILEKMTVIADTLSKGYFNNLEIEVSSFDQLPEEDFVKINLKEQSQYDGPGSLPSYQSWYDYFQGSYGGKNTTIILRESFLQRDYESKWVDGLVFYYQGKPMEPMDHLFLRGLIRRDMRDPV